MVAVMGVDNKDDNVDGEITLPVVEVTVHFTDGDTMPLCVQFPANIFLRLNWWHCWEHCIEEEIGPGFWKTPEAEQQMQLVESLNDRTMRLNDEKQMGPQLEECCNNCTFGDVVALPCKFRKEDKSRFHWMPGDEKSLFDMKMKMWQW